MPSEIRPNKRNLIAEGNQREKPQQCGESSRIFATRLTQSSIANRCQCLQIC